MAPPGRPNDPPNRRRPGNPDPDDWDWGEDEWDETPAASRARARGESRASASDRSADAARDDERGGADQHHDADERDLASGRARPDDSASSADTRRSPPARPRTPNGGGSRAAAIVRRRRLLAGGGVVVVLLLLILGVSALASGGEDDPRAASVPLLAGPMKLAAAESADSLERVDALRRFAEMGEPIYCGAGKKPWVALTYDDGPGVMSPKWIALLSKEKIPVTSFRVGTAVPGNERYVEVQRNLGWDSGTHTQNHPDLTTLSASEQRREIQAGIDASTRVLGREPQLFRPPYQAHNATTDKILKDLGQVQILWNVDTQDSLGPTTVAKIAKNAIDGLRPGAIILMHETKDQTYKAMPAIIAEMRKRKLQPVTISQLLAGDPPSEQQVRQGFNGCNTQQSLRPGEDNRPGEVGGAEATT
ncbi:MAG: polysaccharide deacetylase family protein [Patulibacter sp.]|nr:polysaccharide deacetylase family protein [Patulibacter sp.]